MDDLISRQWLMECVNEGWIKFDTEKDENRFVHLVRDIAPSAQPDHIGEVTEMVGDAVSRQGVLRLLNAVPSEEFATRAMLISGVNALPPEQPVEDARAMCGECDAWNQYKNYPQPRWIPCSKKLPEPNRSVLVQLSDDFVDPIQIMTLNISKCEGDFFYFWKTQEMGINFEMGDVVAWMPLPTPWEGGQDGEG